MSNTTVALSATRSTTKLGPTGELAGRRSTPLNTLEGTSMSTIESIGHAANAARSSAARAVELFQAGKLTADELAADVGKANGRIDTAVAAMPVPACPAWCRLPAGHPQESVDGDGEQVVLTRWHKRTFHRAREFELFVEAEERATAAGVVLGTAGVSAIGEFAHADYEEARAVARALLAAATELRLIQLEQHVSGGAR